METPSTKGTLSNPPLGGKGACSISLKEKLGYGLGDAASSMFWKIFGM
jgi:hypothetical protein